jgi:hypothetical protein
MSNSSFRSIALVSITVLLACTIIGLPVPTNINYGEDKTLSMCIYTDGSVALDTALHMINSWNHGPGNKFGLFISPVYKGTYARDAFTYLSNRCSICQGQKTAKSRCGSLAGMSVIFFTAYQYFQNISVL